VLARVGTQDPNTETRIEAARTLVNNVFDRYDDVTLCMMM
jgi:hypothetical protein